MSHRNAASARLTPTLKERIIVLKFTASSRPLALGGAALSLFLGAGPVAWAQPANAPVSPTASAAPAAGLGPSTQRPATPPPRLDVLEFTAADGRIQRRILPRELQPAPPVRVPGQPATATPPAPVPEAVRDARLILAAAKDREAARATTGAAPPPLTPEFEAALRTVSDYNREQTRVRAREALERTNLVLAQTDLPPEARESLIKSRDLLMRVLEPN